ncbi:MAG: xanthine dehydrogenase family protein subunit M, partial [Anaerolineales bacterium]|nr:xanthine dehydrogenase family protein subunit M [Anaerolineales bacterium]
GGQSLIPMMNFRLAQPSVLVDLNKLAELSFIRAEDDGELRIGAMTRHFQVERDDLVAEHAPLIHEAMPKIATPQIRSRGTFGGSIAHADPAAELTTICVALDGRFRCQSVRGERWVPAKEFFLGMFTSVLEPDEMLVEIAIPPMAPRTGWALEEETRRAHDFALVGVGAVLTLDAQNCCEHARLVFLSVGDGPVEAVKATEILIGKEVTPDLIQAAAEAVTDELDPSADIHASVEYRLHLARVLAKRALEKAFARAAAPGTQAA